ncbi:MAG: response regulator [Promethearchaeota archaeon]
MAKHAEILLIDDNPKDIMLIRNYLIQQNSHINLIVTQNYVDAIEYLFSITSDDTQLKPQLILLEITVSNGKGKKLLNTIKDHHELKKIPLLVLTNSKDSKDAQECYKQYANAFIQKPQSKERYLALIKNILKFWMEIVSLPEYTWS